MKYRKKPIVIEAYQTQEPFEIETLEGVMRANAGDWIITGVNGERYPCKPDIFEKTYEPADNQNFLTALCPWCGETLRVDWQNRVIHGVTEPFYEEVSE